MGIKLENCHLVSVVIFPFRNYTTSNPTCTYFSVANRQHGQLQSKEMGVRKRISGDPGEKK